MGKIKYQTVKRLSAVDAAYLAGIIDGEGTIALTRRNIRERRHAAITIANTDLDMLKWVKNAVGVGNISSKRTYNEKWTPSYVYNVACQQALSILKQVTPHLKTGKRERARLLLESYTAVTARNGKYTEEQLRKRAELEKKFFAIKTRA